MKKTYFIEDGEGNPLEKGLRAFEVEKVAQKLANARGETVYLYSDDPDDDDVEEIKPRRGSRV